jgi:hypothetical protein
MTVLGFLRIVANPSLLCLISIVLAGLSLDKREHDG